VCEYAPVKMLARLGQQRGFVTKPFVNVTP
jgi:hypothetical protein